MTEAFDVIVLGTGAAGLTAAVAAADGGARVAIIEKGDQVGGTSAWSGGHVWIPNNPHMAAVGATDSPELALTYIMSLSRGMIDERLIRAYIAAGPEMVRSWTQMRARRSMPSRTFRTTTRSIPADCPVAGGRSSARSFRSTSWASGQGVCRRAHTSSTRTSR